MADRYRGPAFVLGLDSNQREVHAELHRFPTAPGGLNDWGGTLMGDTDWWGLMQRGDHVELRMPDDRCGSVILATHDVGSAMVGIQGSGPCPFD